MAIQNVLILGMGGIGFHIAKRLTHEGYSVTIVEAKPEVAQYCGENLDCRTIEGGAMEVSSWKKARAEKMDLVIATTNDDAVNLVAALIAERFGIPFKIVRTRSLDFGETGKLLSEKDLTIDLMVHPEELVAQEIARLVQRSAGNDVIDIGGGQMKVLALRVEEGGPLANKQLIEISQIYNEFLFRVVAIGRGITTIIPGGQNEILPHDQVFILSLSEDIPKLM